MQCYDMVCVHKYVLILKILLGVSVDPSCELDVKPIVMHNEDIVKARGTASGTPRRIKRANVDSLQYGHR